MRTWIAILCITIGAGCTVVQEKRERYEEVSRELANPDNVQGCYRRKGDKFKYVMEYRCSGEDCEIPECPSEKAE